MNETVSCKTSNGEMSEWLKEAVLKTSVRQRTVGSNPTLSAKSADRNAVNKLSRKGFMPERGTDYEVLF